MKLPLYHYDYYGDTLVADAEHKVLCRMPSNDIKFARALVRKFNRCWRWRLFGMQPYVYTREDWLLEKNTKNVSVTPEANSTIPFGRFWIK